MMDPIGALLAAIKANDAAALQVVLVQNPTLKSRIDEPLPKYGFDEPPILAAVHKQNREMVDALLDFGANINERSRWWAGGFGVLDFARPELAAHLISRGATVDIHSAARLGRIERVREFLLVDATLVHARGGDGQLPLHFAATVEIAALLLAQGADIDALDVDHESSALQFAVCQQPYRHDVARFLLSRNAKADVLAAAAVGDLGLVERMLNDAPEQVLTTVTESDFPKQDPRSGGCIYIYGFGFGTTVHSLALQFGHAGVFELLMQRSPDWLRLLQAAELDDRGVFREILGEHPELIAGLTDAESSRLVGVAVRNKDAALKRLVEAGWPVNVALDNRQTPLHYASWNGNLAMVETLLAHEATVDVFEDEHGGSPLAWALYGSLHGTQRDLGDYAGVVRALLQAGATLPKTEYPLEASDEVFEVLRTHGV